MFELFLAFFMPVLGFMLGVGIPIFIFMLVFAWLENLNSKKVK